MPASPAVSSRRNYSPSTAGRSSGTPARYWRASGAPAASLPMSGLVAGGAGSFLVAKLSVQLMLFLRQVDAEKGDFAAVGGAEVDAGLQAVAGDDRERAGGVVLESEIRVDLGLEPQEGVR